MRTLNLKRKHTDGQRMTEFLEHPFTLKQQTKLYQLTWLAENILGVTWKLLYTESVLCSRDLTGAESEPLQKRIMCFSHEVIRFPVFKLGVLSTFIYQGKSSNSPVDAWLLPMTNCNERCLLFWALLSWKLCATVPRSELVSVQVNHMSLGFLSYQIDWMPLLYCTSFVLSRCPVLIMFCSQLISL